MIVNEVVSDELKVKPLKEGEAVQFKLCAVGTTEKGRETPSRSTVYQLADRCVIYDPFAKRNVTIGNVTSLEEMREAGGRPKIENGKPVMGYKLEKPQFVKGFLSVNYERQDTYAYLIRHKGNKDNKFRPRNLKPVFELVSTKKDLEDAMQIDDLQFRAQTLVRSSDWDQVRAMKNKLDKMADVRFHVGTDDLQGMKLGLGRLAKSYPKQLILAANDLKSIQAVHIYDALTFGILVYDDGIWYHCKKDKMHPILTTPADMDKVEALVELFNKDEAGVGLHGQISTELKKILSATR